MQQQAFIFSSSYIAKERIKERKRIRKIDLLVRASVTLKRGTIRYADIWTMRKINLNYSLNSLKNLSLEAIRNRTGFLRVLKKAMQNLGLLAMPSLSGLKLNAYQLKILAIIRARKISLFMFMLYLHNRSKEIIVLNASREIDKQKTASSAAPTLPSYNHGISLYNEVTNRFRNEVAQTKQATQENWQNYWQDRIKNEKRTIAQTKHSLNNDWKSFTRSR